MNFLFFIFIYIMQGLDMIKARAVGGINRNVEKSERVKVAVV